MLTFRNISFKNKTLSSTLLVILLLSVGVTAATRWVLLPSLTSELKRRGKGIAQSIADRSKGYVLTQDKDNLVSLIFDAAQLGERRQLIAYVFVLDKQLNVLSHTFTHVFPEYLRNINIVLPGQAHTIKLVRVNGESSYDIAVPILEGIYRIGTVHVGLSKNHLDRLIGKLAITFFGIIAAIIVIGFFISHWLSKYITQPISHLTKVSDQISHGNLDIKIALGSKARCWEIENCTEVSCPAYHYSELPCWYIDGTLCAMLPVSKFPEKRESCKNCIVYAKYAGDEIEQLADSFSNMTCRLRASEAEIKESEERYRFLFDYDPNSIFVLDADDSRISDVNARALEIYGYEKEDLIGKFFIELGPEGYNDGILSLKGRESSILFSVYTKIQHWRKDGEPFYVNVYAHKTGHTPKYGIIVTTIDITESLAKESQLIQASKMSTLGEMASGVAHELNQPLSAMLIGADFINNVIKHGGEIPKSDLILVSYQIREQVYRAAGIINHLREFGRKTDIKREKIYINKPIEGVFTLLGQQLKLRGIKVVLDLKDDLPPIIGDTNRLEQVFINLIVNARNAMEEKEKKAVGGHVDNTLTVKSFQENGQVSVTITDTGAGIPDDIRNRIFEPFFTTKEVGRGTGLGLSISYGIVKDYGGIIEVESEMGKGTTFKIAFPACDEEQNDG